MLGGRGHGDSKQGGILSECLVFMKDFAQVCNLVYRVAYIDGGHADPRGMTPLSELYRNRSGDLNFIVSMDGRQFSMVK